jgi:hypothetical protein
MPDLPENNAVESETDIPGKTIFETVAAIILVLVLSGGGAVFFGIAPW